MKNMVKRVVLRLFPELESRIHLPVLAQVIAIPDPPRGDGEKCEDVRPRYAVDIRLLKPDLSIDDAMPLLRDVPVCLAGADDDRGFALLPQPGSIVEVAFAYGRQSLPFIRGVLPFNRTLPKCDGPSARWQQNRKCYQEVSRSGSWTRTTSADINDNAANIAVVASNKHSVKALSIERTANSTIETSLVKHSILAPKLMLGDGNLLATLSAFMSATIEALDALANHTHPQVAKPQNKSEIEGYIGAAEDAMAANDAMMP